VFVGLCLVANAAAAESRQPMTAPPLSHPRPPAMTLGARLSLGFFFGGDGVMSRDGLPAGDGVMFALGASTTPLWVANQRLGLGFDLDAGFKYASSINELGGVTMRRFPFVLSAHALLQLSEHFLLPLAAGPHAELGIRWWGGRGASRKAIAFSDALGFMVESGILYADLPFTVGMTLRYTGLTYSAPISEGASNLGIVMTFGYYFL
jgi:hypothetical protein